MPKKKADNRPKDRGIRRVAVTGFKSLLNRQEIEIRHLTVLAGANSSGKSSIMQPLLLLKQTLEAPYDSGALKLDGPNVRYTAAEQFLSKKDKGGVVTGFKVELSIVAPSGTGDRLDLTFEAKEGACRNRRDDGYGSVGGHHSPQEHVGSRSQGGVTEV